jgi:hypothetical protein
MDFYLQFKKNHRRILNPKFVVNDLVDLVPFYCFDHNMQQQSGTAATHYPIYCGILLFIDIKSTEFYFISPAKFFSGKTVPAFKATCWASG